MNLNLLTKEILAGKRLTKEDDLSFLLEDELKDLCKMADILCRHYMGNKIDLCAIINGKQGGCSENCGFCSQSAHNHSGLLAKSFLSKEEILIDAKKFYDRGVDRYCIVTAGDGISKRDLNKACETYKELRKECPDFGICASHGHITEADFRKLKESGVDRYHENIETSENYFSKICTSHTFKDQVDTVKKAKAAGMKVCCGGIIGMGESWQDRIDMALTLSELDVDSIPINALMPVKGTQLGNREALSEEEILRSLCIFRILNPACSIRIAAGRILMSEGGKKAFLAGVDSALTGEMLTTVGNNMEQDIAMLKDMGFTVLRNS